MFDVNKLTKKSTEALLSAKQRMEAQKNGQLEPCHLAAALLSDRDGLIPSLLTKMSIDPNAMLAAMEREIAALPKLSYTEDRLYLSKESEAVFNEAEQCANKMGDEYISVEHLFLFFL